MGENPRYTCDLCLFRMEMDSLSGIIQRPLVSSKQQAVAAASVSVELPGKFSPSKMLEDFSSCNQIESSPSTSLCNSNHSLVSHIPASKLSNPSFVRKILVLAPDIKMYPVTSVGSDIAKNPSSSCVVSLVALWKNLYQPADLVKAPKLNAFTLSRVLSLP